MEIEILFFTFQTIEKQKEREKVDFFFFLTPTLIYTDGEKQFIHLTFISGRYRQIDHNRFQ